MWKQVKRLSEIRMSLRNVAVIDDSFAHLALLSVAVVATGAQENGHQRRFLSSPQVLSWIHRRYCTLTNFSNSSASVFELDGVVVAAAVIADIARVLVWPVELTV